MSVALWTTALGRASLEAAGVALAVAVLVRVAPRVPAAARCALWWLASLRALVALAGVRGVALPLLPAPATVPGAQVAMPAFGGTAVALPPLPVSAPGDPLAWAWLALAALWAAGGATLILRQILAARRVLRLWREAAPHDRPATRAWLAVWLGESRAARVELRESGDLRAPLILGWGRPRILVPAPFPGDDPVRARMALAHEAGHLLRRDLLWGWVPAAAEVVFWFHPIVRWAVREYVQSREEACDARAIELTGAEPGGYGDMLVRFGVDRVRFGHAAASCGSRHARQLRRRLHMLSQLTTLTRMQRLAIALAVALFALLAVVPMRVVAARGVAPEPSPVAPAAAVAAPAPNAGTIQDAPTASSPVPPAAPARLAANLAGGEDGDDDDDAQQGGSSFSWTDHGDGFSYGLMSGADGTYSGSFGNADWDRMRRLRKANPGRILWFRLAGRDYVVRDRATWDQVQALMKPQIELGRRQGDLGAQQGELGAQQAELGGRQADLGAQQAHLSAELMSLTMDASFGDASRAERAEMKRRIETLEARIRELSERQRDLGEQQHALGEKQHALGERQHVLGEQQRVEADKARAAVRRVAERCVNDGRAERWRD